MPDPDTDPDSARAAGSDADAVADTDVPGRGSGFVLAVSLAVVFAVVAAVFAVLLAREPDDELRDLREAAGEFAEALVTYDHENLDAHRDAVLAMSTGSFRDEYARAFDQGLRDLIAQVEAVQVGHVKDIYLSEVDAQQAQAVVVIDTVHDGTGGRQPLYDMYFRLTLIQVDGDWFIDDVTDLNFGTGSGNPIPGGVTTDTTPEATTSTTTSLP